MSDLRFLEDIDNKTFLNFIKLIHRLTGIKIENNRKPMLIGRLRKRIIALQLNSFDEYYDFVESNQQEQNLFIDNITTNQTYCYRTPRIWCYLIETYLPWWVEHFRGKTLYAWTAAASSGEETYTLGAILHHFKIQEPRFQFQIVGTDISHSMIRLCQLGQYHEHAIQRLRQGQPSLFANYFVKLGDYYSVIPLIRQHIFFKQHNLFHRLNFPYPFHIVLLRNVLIYFAPEDQESLLELVHQEMSQEGVLIIGESESLNFINTSFRYEDTLIYRKNV